MQLIFNLIIAHIIGDFYLQGSCFCKNKLARSARGWALWIHAFIVGALSWLAAWDIHAWWLAAAIMASHFLLDWLKSFLQVKMKVHKYDLFLFLADQTLHIVLLCIFAQIWLSVNKEWCQFEWLQKLMTSHPLRVNTVVAMLLALKPANILILHILDLCKVNSCENKEKGFSSGELIGWLERGLMLLFMVMGRYEAVGFLIAAKSIIRFKETEKGEMSEYVLAGTLLSLSVVVVLAILVVRVVII